MKTLPGTFGSVVAVLGIAFASTLSAFAQNKSESVTFETNAVLIPGTKISGSDEKALNAILEEYDQSLYQIRTYEKGRHTKTKGTLGDVVLKKTRASEFVKNAEQKGFSNWALQIGFDIGMMATPTPTSGKAGKAKNASYDKSLELVARVTPILKKYSVIKR